MPRPVWRRFVVPANITLDKLHDIIQVIMGWDDCHLHSFDMGDYEYVADFVLEYDDFGGQRLPEKKYTLESLAPKKGAKIRYQ